MHGLTGRHLIIRADASTEIGTGHLMRCLALAQAWKDVGGKVVFITACENRGLLKQLKEEGFDIHQLTDPYPDAGDWECTGEILHSYPDAWVVIDGYHFDEVYQQLVKRGGHQLLVTDDTAHLKHYYVDIVLNQNLHAEQLQYSCQSYTRLLLGTSYVLLRREFLAWMDWRREVPEVAQHLLVTMGGGDAENHTLKVIQALQKIEVPGMEAVVAVGAVNPHANMLETVAKQSHIPIRLIHDARNMPELMVWADMAISTAGSTVWELFFLGTPALLLVVADNQCYSVKQIEDQGAAENLGLAGNISIGSLAKAITLLSKDSDLRRTMSESGQRIIDGGGIRRVIASLQ